MARDRGQSFEQESPQGIPRQDYRAAASGSGEVGGAGGGGGPKLPQDQRDEGVATRTREEVKRPERYKVLLYNDDYTPMDFVVGVLTNVFGKSPAAATQIMLQVHRAGMGVAGVYILEIAETKVAAVHSLAEERGYPLRSGTEKE
jgi:ATP-dependent Clp protease adaptor protein ClpS